MSEIEKLTAQLKRVQAENLQMQKLATVTGYFDIYFANLKHFKTNTETFHYVNDLYFNFFGEYRYSSYTSFQNCLKKHYKK